jgi:dihydroflavonol-4-reductase
MDALAVVTGGAGFIGSHLVDRLVARGRLVRVVERPGADCSHLPPNVQIVRADIRDRDAVRTALLGATEVFHLAANPNLWVRDRREFDDVNHQGTIHVLDAAIAAGARRILHTSTESILTCARSSGPIAEDVEVTEADAVGPYCLSKLRAEKAAKARADAGHPILIANPTMPVGPGDRGLSPPSRLILDFSLGRLPARMDCTLNLIDVRDVAEGLVRVVERGQPGRRYLLGGENLDLLGLFRILSELTGRPVPRWNVPYPVGLSVAALSEFWADHVSGRPPKATITGVRLTRRTMHFDARRSLSALDLSPRPVRESLEDAVSWLREQGKRSPAHGSTSRTTAHGLRHEVPLGSSRRGTALISVDAGSRAADNPVGSVPFAGPKSRVVPNSQNRLT